MQSQLTYQYDVFISYRRTPEDEELRDRFIHAIERLELRPFSDATSLPAGIQWEDAIHEVLRDNAILVVLGTDSTLRDPNWVKKEVDQAKELGNDILLFEFADGVAAKLGLLKKQYRTAKLYDDKASLEELFTALEKDLHECLRRRLLTPRQEVKAWAKGVLDRLPTSFWRGNWRTYFPGDSSVAVLADGGSGKTVCLAHYLLDVLQRDEGSLCHAMLIDSSVLKGGASEVAKLIRAHTGNVVEHASRLKKDWNEWFLFVVDGLDRVGFESRKVLDDIKETLRILSECGRVVVTCRQQVWENDYQGLSFESQPIGALSEEIIRSSLSNLQLTSAQREILGTPLFLDYALTIVDRGRPIPENTTQFLSEIYDQPVRLASSGTVPEDISNALAEFLKALAQQQLDDMTFEVSREQVTGRVKLPRQDVEKAITELRAAGVLHEKDKLVRLRHDFIDGHGMVRLLYRDAALRQALWERINGDCGWQVASLLMLAAHERQVSNLLSEAFHQFVYILDHKRFTAALMARAWSVTYALRERIGEVWPEIIRYLDGELASSLNPKQLDLLNTHISRPGLVTQETASTFASSFQALTKNQNVDPETVVRVFKRWLYRPGYKFKKRFAESLARIDAKDSRAALLEFARSEAERLEKTAESESIDTELLETLAEALGNSGELAAIPVLSSIYKSEKAGPRARRLALVALHLIDRFGLWPEPTITDDEMVDGLAVKDNTGGYSDWHRVIGYAKEARTRLAKGEHLSERIVLGLVGAMDHQQTFVKKPVAECLGYLDTPDTFTALIKELLSPSGAAFEVRNACINALRTQFLTQTELHNRLIFRWALLFAACRAKQAGHTVCANDLADLATRTSPFTKDDWLVTPTAIQALPLAGKQQGWKVHATVTSGDAHPFPFSIDEFLSDEDLAIIGPPLETKYRLVDAVSGEEGQMNLRLVPTDWVSGRGFHLFCNRDLANVERLIGHSPLPMPLGVDSLPGILSVHCVVMTSDQKILLARRSDKASYFPGHWSVSFEEQVTSKDFNKQEDFVSSTARRGFTEEFGRELGVRRITIISGLVEVQILNFGLVLVLEVDETADMIRKSWQSEPRPRDHHECTEIRDTPVSVLDERSTEILSSMSLHPTSELRVDLWRRWWQTGQGREEASRESRD